MAFGESQPVSPTPHASLSIRPSGLRADGAADGHQRHQRDRHRQRRRRIAARLDRQRALRARKPALVLARAHQPNEAVEEGFDLADFNRPDSPPHRKRADRCSDGLQPAAGAAASPGPADRMPRSFRPGRRPGGDDGSGRQVRGEGWRKFYRQRRAGTHDLSRLHRHCGFERASGTGQTPGSDAAQRRRHRGA
ncbi:MAG: hypothetical protein JMDDDDMK_01005 [Acidobacteria bacterium]|nr:hypothetical protein [Acidobacteriota bacterium]